MIIEAEYEEVDDADGELDLSADDSLPWLEAEEEDDAAGDVDTTQVVAFVVFLLITGLLFVGAVWYFSNQDNGEVVADGSLIEAPDGPLKERPEDPGGKEFDGTGNVAPVVGEGGTREGVIATDDDNGAADREAVARQDSSAEREDASNREASGASAAQAAPAPVASGVAVQLAAYRTRERAQQGWSEINRRTNALSGLDYRIEEGVVDIGKVYRLQAVASDRAAAEQLCAALKDDGVDCQVKL